MKCKREKFLIFFRLLKIWLTKSFSLCYIIIVLLYANNFQKPFELNYFNTFGNDDGCHFYVYAKKPVDALSICVSRLFS